MNPIITVVPLGPGDPELMNQKTLRLLQSGVPIYLRTDHHPAASWLRERHIPFHSFDAMYENAEDFDSLHQEIAKALWQAADQSPIVYAVPDPLTDGSVVCLRTICPADGSLDIIPGISILSACGAALSGRFPLDSFQLCAAASLPHLSHDPTRALVVTEVDSEIQAGNVKLVLSDLLPDEAILFWIADCSAAGLPCVSLPLYELDRQSHYSHLSAVIVPPVPYPQRDRFTLADLEDIMERLRAPDGCPWDKVQTHDSLKQYLVEEAWESVNAIDEQNPEHLADELGDVLLQIVFHASIGRSFDEFTLTDVISDICRKMILRHPHVFGAKEVNSSQEVADTWEEIKRQETGSRTVAESLADVSIGLPSMKYAIKVQKKARQLPALRRPARLIAPEIRALASRLLSSEGTLSTETLGELLFTCMELCYECGVDGEILLHETVDQYKKGFLQAENAILSDGKAPESLTFQELCVYLKKVKERN